MIDVSLVEQFVSQLADALAPRVIAEFSDSGVAPAPTEPWRLLNVDDVCAALGRSERWVRERAKDGRLPVVKLDGGALGFLPDDVRAFAEARRVPPLLPVRCQSPREAAASAGSRNGGRL